MWYLVGFLGSLLIHLPNDFSENIDKYGKYSIEPLTVQSIIGFIIGTLLGPLTLIVALLYNSNQISKFLTKYSIKLEEFLRKRIL